MKHYYQAFVINPDTFDIAHAGKARAGDYTGWLSVNKEIEWTDDADGMWVLIVINEEGKVVY